MCECMHGCLCVHLFEMPLTCHTATATPMHHVGQISSRQQRGRQHSPRPPPPPPLGSPQCGTRIATHPLWKSQDTCRAPPCPRAPSHCAACHPPPPACASRGLRPLSLLSDIPVSASVPLLSFPSQRSAGGSLGMQSAHARRVQVSPPSLTPLTSLTSITPLTSLTPLTPSPVQAQGPSSSWHSVTGTAQAPPSHANSSPTPPAPPTPSAPSPPSRNTPWQAPIWTGRCACGT